MPRRTRIDAPGALHQIICRGIERKAIFQDDASRDDFVNSVNPLRAKIAPSLKAQNRY